MADRPEIIFITGGARSGKSSFAISEAERLGGKMAFIATAEPLDDEMRERIERHRMERGDEWDTVEEAIDLAGRIKDLDGKYEVTVVDCLTMWLSNLLCRRSSGNVDGTVNSIDELIAEIGKLRSGNTLLLVSNEVGMGIVPGNELARDFRDLAGMMNRKIAAMADRVYMVVSGIPITIKKN